MRLPKGLRPRSGYVLLAMLVASACSDGGDGSESTALPQVTPTLASSTAPPSDTAVPTVAQTSTPEATVARGSATLPPDAHASPIPEIDRALRGLDAPDDDGEPFSTDTIARAVVSAGYSFFVSKDRPVVCPGASVEETAFWSSNLRGSDFGPILNLWVYPDADALAAEWEVGPNGAPSPLVGDCELANDFVYVNANAVLAFEVWVSLGEEYGPHGHGESPNDHPAVRAFLELIP